jgi:RNA recognition motif-containing protein
MNTKLHVANLSYNTTVAKLTELFSQAGHVLSVTRPVDRNTKLVRNFAFVEMGTPVEASQAIQTLNGKEVDGCVIKVSEVHSLKADGGFRGSGIKKGRQHGLDQNPRGGSRAGFGRGTGIRGNR